MKRTKRGATGLALGAVVALAAAACSSGSSGGSATQSAGPATKGGTLTLLSLGPHNGLDPQASYVGADLAFANRVYSRSLVAWTPEKESKLVGDLATDAGTVSDGGKTWKFTLKGDAKWQDGKTVTCQDITYGISRTFATDVISNGPTYILNFLDIPKNADGTSQYAGPYKGTGQALFDKAAACSGQTLTLHFNAPWNDFNQASASLAAYNAFRKDKDQGAKSLFNVFSDGPYMLEGTFDAAKGGTWVRNPNWDPATDTLRKAYPDKIVDVEGIQSETTYQRLMADGSADQATTTFNNAPASVLPQIPANPSAAQRSVTVASPYIDYVQPYVNSAAMKNPKVRQAFAMATSRDAYVTASGGTQAFDPTYAMCLKTMKCYKDFNPFGAPTGGDPEGAKKVLADAGVTTPVNITVMYRKSATRDAAFAALKQAWDQGGFNVTLEGLASTGYYRTISGAAFKTSKDAAWSGWGADWQSGSTIIPPLFDSRINLSANSSNQDYGWFDNDTVNKAMDAAQAITDTDAREKAWGDIDEMISKDGGVIPLASQKFTFVWGSKVKNFEVHPLFSSYADMATIAVQ